MNDREKAAAKPTRFVEFDRLLAHLSKDEKMAAMLIGKRLRHALAEVELVLSASGCPEPIRAKVIEAGAALVMKAAQLHRERVEAKR